MWDQVLSYDYLGAWKPVGQFLWDWQTLIAGVIAVIGARYTIKGVREQIAAQRQQDDLRRYDEDFSARALLPLGLDRIGAYADGVLRVLYRAHPNIAGSRAASALILRELPEPPHDSKFAIFREAIRSCSNERKR